MKKEEKRAGRARPLQRRGKEKGPDRRIGAFWNLSRRRPTFPHSYPCSIIGPARLNFRVRDGNGCDPRGMTTGNLGKLAALAISVISNQISVREERSCASEVFGKDWRGATRAPRTTIWLANTSSARCRTITVCYKTLQSGLETSLQ
jgi:hypothetical protein